VSLFACALPHALPAQHPLPSAPVQQASPFVIFCMQEHSPFAHEASLHFLQLSFMVAQQDLSVLFADAAGS
jgi:hypothetical protein